MGTSPHGPSCPRDRSVEHVNVFMGADTDQVRSLASKFAEGSQHLQDLRETAEAFVRAVTWTGPDADEFQDRASSVLADLTARASDVADRGRTLDTQAEEQDSVSSPEGSVPGVSAGAGVGAGAGQPGTSPLPDISKWFSDGSKKGDAWKDAGDIIRRAVDKKIDDTVEVLERANGGPSWLRRVKKFVPVIPDAMDFANHAVHGETEEAIFALGRGGLSLTPVGVVEDASAVVFPLMPDDWKLPGTDVPLNEGSLIDGYETYSVENPQEDSEMSKSIREGERFGGDISDQLGIENEYVRNSFKTAGGITGAVGAAYRDPEDGSPWYLGKDFAERLR